MTANNERDSRNKLSENSKDLIFVIASNAIEGFYLNEEQIRKAIEELDLAEESEFILNKLGRLKTAQQK